MNREIKFRGYNNTMNRWCHGYYVAFDNITHEIHECVRDGKQAIYEAIPESVGQYSGVKNQHGVDIFEDDIIHVEGYGNYIVEWFEGGFITEFLGEPTEQYLNCNFFDYSDNGVIKCTVIGNRFQNPELLERKQ